MSHTFEKEAAEALLKYGFQNDSPPSDFYLRLMTDAKEEIPPGNGYSAGGVVCDFGTPTTGSDYAQIVIDRTVFHTDGGQVPVYGAIRYMDLTDDDGLLLARFDLDEDGIIIPINKQLAITNATIRLYKVTADGATFTLNGLKGLLQWAFEQTGAPTTFYLALLTPDSPWGETLGACEEIPIGNGYNEGGIAVARSTTGFIELDNDWQPVRHASIEIAQKLFETAGGQLPRYGFAQKAALTMDGTPISSRKVIAIFDFDEAVSAPNGKLILTRNATMWINETETVA